MRGFGQADRLGLAIRGTILLLWGWLAWSGLRTWWAEGRSRPRGAPRIASEAPRSLVPVFTAATGVALLLLVTLPYPWGVLAAPGTVIVSVLAHELSVHWREDRAREEAYRAAVHERHQRALAAGVGLAWPSRLRRRGPARACPACLQMYALWDANRELSVDQAEAIVERQIVLGTCLPHSWWRDE